MSNEKTFTYTGLKIGSGNDVTFRALWPMSSAQDGAIYGDTLFRFNSDGSCRVYALPSMDKTASFILDKNEVLCMHSNAVSFSRDFYAEGDEFPLVYTNIYNNYSSAEDCLAGVCGAYRITRTETGFASRLVQVIRIGFTGNSDLWCSKNVKDVRPYGNFVIDTDRRQLCAFTMRDEERQTRVFTFALPALTDGVYSDVYEANVVTLNPEDILSMFNCNYSQYLQGACYYDGKIYSVEGFSNAENPAKLQVFDLIGRRQYASVDLFGYGIDVEPEFIDPYKGGFIYSDGYGRAWEVNFP